MDGPLQHPRGLRTIAHPELLGQHLPYAIALGPFQPHAAMPANTFTYKALGEQDYRRNTMSYAVIVTGGKQYKVAPGEYLKIEKLEIANGDDVNIGAPVVPGATVVAEVISQGRHDKVRIIKFRRRKHHMKRMGHRQWYTEIKITGIQA